MPYPMKSRWFVLACVAILFPLAAATAGEAQVVSFMWSTPIDITRPSTSYIGRFGQLLCDQGQNLHMLWSDVGTRGAAIFYRTDRGKGWSVPVDVIATSADVAGDLDATISSYDQTLHAIWSDQYIRGNLNYSRVSLLDADDPRAWSKPESVAYGIDLASIEVGTDGTVHIVYGLSEDATRGNDVYYIKSPDGGTTWSDPQVIYSVITELPSSIEVETAIDSANRIHVGITRRSQEYGVSSEIGYMHSLDSDQVWSPYLKIADVGTSFQGVARIAPYVFGEDEIHLTWSDPRRMHQWSLDGGQTWSHPIEIMPLGAAFGGFNELVKDSAGTLHVVAAVGNGVYSATWAGSRWLPPEQIDNRSFDPHGQKITVCRGNQLHVTYYDRTGINTVWYAYKQVNAPYLEPKPLLVVTSVPSATLSATPTSTPASTIVSDASLATAAGYGPSGPIGTAADQVVPLLVSVFAVVALLAVVYALRHRIKD